MCNPPAHLVLAMHGALTRGSQPFSKVASQGPTAGFPHKLPSRESRSAGSQSWEDPWGQVQVLLLAGTQQKYSWHWKQALSSSPGDHTQLAPSLPCTLAVVSPTLPPLVDFHTFPKSPHPHPPAPHIPPFLSSPFSQYRFFFTGFFFKVI